jgi:hypothetical protein
MFKIVRNIHLYSAFVIAPFLLMYLLTGAVMITDIFPQMTSNILTEKIAIKYNQTETETITEICKQHNIYGEQSIDTGTNGMRNYLFFRPGYRAELTFTVPESFVLVKIDEGTFGSVMNDFHRIRGYNGSWTHILWSILYDLCCMALLIFAFTGVYLWWKMEPKKLTGVIFLLISTGITAFTIAYIIALS